jgi:hypothetical protein
LALCCRRATCKNTCGAIRTLAEGGAELWDRGCHDAFELDLAGARRLLGKIMVSYPKTLLFFVFGENQPELFSGKISAPMYLYLT